MNEKTLTLSRQGQARWRRRGRYGASSLRPGQPSIHLTSGKFRPAAVGCCDAIQHPKQRSVAGIVQVHEREARLDISRHVSQIDSGTIGQRPAVQNGARQAPQPRKLVRHNVGGAGSNQRAGNHGFRFSAWSISPLVATRKKRVVLYENRINSRLIDTVSVLGAIPIDTVSVLIRGFFGHSPSTVSVHLLVMPLHTMFCTDLSTQSKEKTA